MAAPPKPRIERLIAFSQGPWAPIAAFALSVVWAYAIIPQLLLTPTEDVTLWDMAENNHFRTWQLTIVLQVPLWLASIVYALRAARQIADEKAKQSRFWIIGFVLTFVMLCPALVPYAESMMYYLPVEPSAVRPSIPFNIFFGAAAMWALFMMLATVHANANERARRDGGDTNLAIKSYRTHRVHLSRALLLFGVLLSTALVGYIAHTKASQQLEGVPIHLRLEDIYRWAAFASCLLAIVYLGARLALERWGRKLMKTLLESAPTATDDHAKRHDAEKAASALLELDQPIYSELQSVFGVLAPVVGVAASAYLGV